VSATYLQRPTANDAELEAHFRPVFAEIAQGSRDRERHRVFPHDEVRRLNDAGFGTLRIPTESGGFGASLEQTFLLLAQLADADANVSHIWRNHLAFVEDRLNAPRSDTDDVWIKRFLAGAFIGGGWTEANNLTLANLATTVTAEDDQVAAVRAVCQAGHGTTSGDEVGATHAVTTSSRTRTPTAATTRPSRGERKRSRKRTVTPSDGWGPADRPGRSAPRR